MTAAVKTRLDKAVANKRITAAQEQKLLKALSPASTPWSTTRAPKGPRFARTRTRVSEGFPRRLRAAREPYPRSACASERPRWECLRPQARSPERRPIQRLQTYAALIELSRVSDRRLLYWGSIDMRYESFRSNVQ